MPQNQKGFTLTEISIVSTIIVILGLAIILALNPLTQLFKGYDTIRKADLEKIRLAFESYYEDHLCYPYDIFPIDPVTEQATYVCDSNVLAPYLEKMPCDPNTHEPYSLYNAVKIASERVCPTKFAVYTTLSNIFDPALDLIAVCDNKYVVGHFGISEGFAGAACAGGSGCSEFWGCKNGACVKISDDYPTCESTYCTKQACDDHGQCSSNECTPF